MGGCRAGRGSREGERGLSRQEGRVSDYPSIETRVGGRCHFLEDTGELGEELPAVSAYQSRGTTCLVSGSNGRNRLQLI
jgi:hypothetical protein